MHYPRTQEEAKEQVKVVALAINKTIGDLEPATVVVLDALLALLMLGNAQEGNSQEHVEAMLLHAIREDYPKRLARAERERATAGTTAPGGQG